MLDNVLGHLPKEDQINARLVCKKFDQHLRPKVFDQVTINFSHRGRQAVLNTDFDSFIEFFTSDGCAATSLPRYLEINRWFSIDLLKILTWRYAEEPLACVISLDKKKKQDLLNTVSKFKRLKGVNWAIDYNIDPRFTQNIMDTLMGLGTIKEFCVKAETPVQFDGFRDLRGLVIHANASINRMDVLGQLQTVIGKSPNLRYLGLNLTRNAEFQYNLDYQLDAFSLTKEQDSLPLEHLMIAGGWGFKLNGLYRHLRNLKTLEVTGEDSLSIELEVEQDANWNQFWEGLQENKIWLKKIKFPVVSVALLNYMASYSGVEELIVEIPVYDTALSNETGLMFFADVLPKHAGSLRVLRVKEYFQSTWCFGTKEIAQLGSSRLEELSVPIVESEEMTTPNTQTSYLGLLAGITTLKHLEIPTIFPEAYRTERLGVLYRWAVEHNNYFTNHSFLEPVAPYPEFITLGYTLLKYQKETSHSAATYQAVPWYPEEKYPGEVRKGMIFIDGGLVMRRPVLLSKEYFGNEEY
ncbi:MAG: hypothetical protein M1840_007842 [Geoglossum simile]|nr:MAG: hypothetical protein M1840_007842 [Geoglossum simile]